MTRPVPLRFGWCLCSRSASGHAIQAALIVLNSAARDRSLALRWGAAAVSEAGIDFGPVRLILDRRLLLVDGEPAKLGARAFDILVALFERRDRLVDKRELLDAVWPGRVVEENNLHVHIAALRKLLGPQAIATVPGRGYRFTLIPDRKTAIASQPPTSAVSARVPAALPELFGRDTELAELAALIRSHALVSLSGAGGIGKSATARHLLRALAPDCAQGGVWVDLAVLSAPQATDVALAVAAAAGVQSGGGEPLAGLVRALAPLELLLVLDNAEHLVAELAQVVAALRAAAPRLRLLVTSQVPLKLAGEQVYRLGPLAVPQRPDVSVAEALTHGAVRLFADRAAAADRHFALDDERLPLAVDICRRLDGLPLAIELAAARVAGLGLTQLQAALDRRFRLLTQGRRDAPERQQTLLAALDWSHRLLSPVQRTVFRRLAVFVGGWTLEAAVQVAGDADIDEWAVLDALVALVERALVVADAGEPPRYRLLDTPRGYALAQLQEAGELGVVRARHAQALRQQFEAASSAYYSGAERIDAMRRRLAADIDNGREALAWALGHDATTAVALAADMARELDESSTRSSRQVFDATAALVETAVVDPPLQARWYLAAALAHGRTRPGLTAAHARRAVALCRQSGDRRGLYRGLSYLVFGADEGSAEQAQAMDELRAIEDPHWPPMLRALGANAETFVHHALGDYERAAFYIRRRMALLDEAGCPDTRAMVNLIDIELTLGRVDDALRTGLELERRLQGTRTRLTELHARRNLTAAWLAKGDTQQARAVAARGWPLTADFGLQADWVDYLALLCALEQRHEDAARLQGLADALCEADQGQRSINEARAASRVQASLAGLPPQRLSALGLEGAALARQRAADRVAWVAGVAFAGSGSSTVAGRSHSAG